jgi:bifunctional enzyme CysN/CysC
VDGYETNHVTGSLVFVDELSNATAGAAMITESVFVDSASPRVVSDSATLIREHVERREFFWETGLVSVKDRLVRNRHVGKTVVITGSNVEAVNTFGKALELQLFKLNLSSYFLGFSSLLSGLASDVVDARSEHDAQIHRLGELARILTDAGLLFITAMPQVDRTAMERLRALNEPNELLLISLGDTEGPGVPSAIKVDPLASQEANVKAVLNLLVDQHVIPDYCI